MTEFLGNASNWVLISFVIFLYVFFKYGYKSMTDKLDKRIANIETELQTVEALRIEAQELLAQYQRKHRDALKEADDILAGAKKQAEVLRKQAEKDLEESKSRREKQLQERLARVEREAVQEIRQYAASVSVQAAETLIKDKMDKKASKKLLDTSIEQIPDYLN